MTRTLFPSSFRFRTLASGLVALAAALVATLAAPGTAKAAEDLDRRVQTATWVLQDLQKIPEQAIPPNLLNSAYAIAVLPNVTKAGFIVGGSYGKGVLLVRQPDGSWSNPSFIKLANLGIGWQAGAQGADLVLVFKTQRGVENIARGKFTLGGSASASAGPVGRTALAMTDGEFKSEIYTYARSRGLFAGVSLDGGAITIDQVANASWYSGARDTTANTIFTDTTLVAPAPAQGLKSTLTAMAPRVDWKSAPAANAAAGTPAAPAPEAPASKTYAVDDDTQSPETRF
jgi:lipid-binding SYLF domain-containing protein